MGHPSHSQRSGLVLVQRQPNFRLLGVINSLDLHTPRIQMQSEDDPPVGPVELPWWCQPNTVEERPLLEFLKQCFENAEEGIRKVSSAVPVSA